MLIACGSFSPPTPMHFRMFGEWQTFFLSSENISHIAKTSTQFFCLIDRNRQRLLHRDGPPRSSRRHRFARSRCIRQARPRATNSPSRDGATGAEELRLDSPVRVGVQTERMVEDAQHTAISSELSQLGDSWHWQLQREWFARLDAVECAKCARSSAD